MDDKYKYFYPVSDVCCLVSILVEVFDKVVHTPLPGETEAYIPSEFINARFGDTSCLGDCTETTILPSENFDVNNILFSQYKNHNTGKTVASITQHRSLLSAVTPTREQFLTILSQNSVEYLIW